MSTHQHITLEDTAYLYFASNDTSGSGGDGASAAAAVRLAGAAADATAVLSPSPTLLTSDNYPAGCYEVAVAATAANGFAAGNTYAVFCTLAVDSQNPSGFIGTFTTTALATSDQVSNLSVGSSGLSVNASGVNVTTGNETNAYTDTTTAGTIHIVEDAAGTTLFEYEFDISEYSGTGTEFLWTGYVASNGDEVDVQYYDWVATSWKTLIALDGSNGTTLVDEVFDIPVAGTGTGANLGLVKLRFSSATTTAIGTDRVRLVFTQAATGIANGSTVTFATGQTNKNYVGENWTLVLGGQAISGSYIKGANVTGVSSGTSDVKFEDCQIGAVTLPPGKYIRCGIGVGDGQFTAASDGQYKFVDCYSVVPGSGAPDFAFDGLGAATGINNRGWKGGVAYVLDSDCTLSHEVVAGGGTTITTGGGDAEIRGITRSLVIAMSAAETVQFVGITGPIALSGTTTATVNLYGVSDSVADTTTAATVTDSTVSQDNVADAGLKRDWDLVSGEAARSMLNALRFLRNKWSITGTTLTVTEEDDATAAWTAEVSTDAAADPVTGSNPAGGA